MLRIAIAIAALTALYTAPIAAAQPQEAAPPAPETPEPAAHDAEPTRPELRRRLLELRKKDQEARKAFLDLIPEMDQNSGRVNLENPTPEQIQAVMRVRAVDAETLPFIKGVIEEHGFPTFDMVGRDGAEAAWLLVQHADEDIEFQARALELMAPLVEHGQADPSDFAHLTDRVLLAQGKKQRFGTQFKHDEQGVLRPRPTEDPERLDERRRRYGLHTLAEHIELLEAQLNQPVSAEPLSEDS